MVVLRHKPVKPLGFARLTVLSRVIETVNPHFADAKPFSMRLREVESTRPLRPNRARVVRSKLIDEKQRLGELVFLTALTEECNCQIAVVASKQLDSKDH